MVLSGVSDAKESSCSSHLTDALGLSNITRTQMRTSNVIEIALTYLCLGHRAGQRRLESRSGRPNRSLATQSSFQASLQPDTVK